MWLLTAHYALNKDDAESSKILLYFGYIDKDEHGKSVKASDVLDAQRWYSHNGKVSIE